MGFLPEIAMITLLIWCTLGIWLLIKEIAEIGTERRYLITPPDKRNGMQLVKEVRGRKWKKKEKATSKNLKMKSKK